MSILTSYSVDCFRNLKAVDFKPSPGFNLICGPNGSGKTSLLESIHYLSVGRSFRTHKISPLLQVDQQSFLIVAGIEGKEGRIGLSKSRQGLLDLRVFSESQKNFQTVAELLPLQLINSDSFSLLEGGAKLRRRFLDWMMFHVEHSFISRWRDYRRAVSQRNAVLKSMSREGFGALSRVEQEGLLLVWEHEIATLGELIDSDRRLLFDLLLPYFREIAKDFLPHYELGFEFKSGWDNSESLANTLRDARPRELQYGMTLYGPHRADFQIRSDGVLAAEILSRGQIKLLVCALKLAAGQLIDRLRFEKTEQVNRCTYLIDDLASELDRENRAKVIERLAKSGAQCFFTAIEAEDLPEVAEISLKTSGKFHVEHGKIRSA
ncbi:DNA replication/repair protein RecF [Pseudohongiella spirulinae]|uniref:DNA replication and repair protein RecF n=1 Tax=Pseudohongiella spirulinae TaxID=1249552 RepID=A0A0S2K8S4_9GAMM|nr:DNA replication/repair protein RecF [Pseudohongiella spirulinae]ALO44701.1 recombinase F [Pseudohongiella spirulinae]